MGKKKKSVSQVVISQSDTSDDPKPEPNVKLEETPPTAENSITSDNAVTILPTEETQAPSEQLIKENTPILSDSEETHVSTPENDKKEQHEEDESKTVETTTSSENSVELKEIQIKPEDEPIQPTKKNCSKAWCIIL